MGLGVNLGLYNDHYSTVTLEPTPESQSAYTAKKTNHTENNFDALRFCQCRLSARVAEGLPIPCGVTSGLVLTKNRNTSREAVIAPYISFGKAF